MAAIRTPPRPQTHSFTHTRSHTTGDLAFTLSLTCKLLADLVPSLTGAAVLDVANTLAKTSHFLDVWTRCCLYEDREEVSGAAAQQYPCCPPPVDEAQAPVAAG